MSIDSMVLRIGQTIGPLMVGIAFAIFGLNGAFASDAGIALIMLLPTFVLLKEFIRTKET